MTFFEWAKGQMKRNDLVGDITGDMIRDAQQNNLTLQTVQEWMTRVWFKTHDREIRQAFIKAAKEYRENCK